MKGAAIDRLEDRITSAADTALGPAYQFLIGHDDTAFVERVVAHLALASSTPPNSISDSQIERALKFCFSVVLHEGLAHDGSEEQVRAFEAAKAYLYPKLAHKFAASGMDIGERTDAAVIDAWRAVQAQRVREPGAFLYYLLMTGINQTARQAAQRAAVPLLEEVDSADGPLDGRAPDGTRPLEAAAEAGWLASALRKIIADCLRTRPFYQHLLEAHFFDSRSIPELAEAWGKTANLISVAKHRALELLRKCGQWLELAAMLGRRRQPSAGMALND